MAILKFINDSVPSQRKIVISRSGVNMQNLYIFLLDELLPFDETVKKYLENLSELISKKKKEFKEM